jgi:transcriptional regulator with XRE-family HTH domain
MDDIGKKIRKERKNRGITLEQIAAETGLSKSYLSNLERGLTEPTVSTLKKISAQLQLSLLELVGNRINATNGLGYPAADNQQLSSQYITDVKVVEPEQRKTFTLPGSSLTFELLTPDLKRQFEVYLFKAKPGEKLGEESMVDPPGEKFGMVLKGVMETRILDNVYTLGPGHTIYFPAHYPHSWRCVGEEPLEVIVVVCPPWF